MKTAIFANPFVFRQTAESSQSHSDKSWDQLCQLALDNFDRAIPGYRPGVLEVPIPADGVYSGVVALKDGDKLSGQFVPRREGETPRIEIRAHADQKLPAEQATIILYSSAVLAERVYDDEGNMISGDDNSQPPVDGNWEIVSLNSSPVKGDMPIDPMVLMHNAFGSDGGTATEMDDAELVALLRKGFNFWKDKAMIAQGGE